MPNPQQPELRRSEEILRPRPELGPDPQDFDGGQTGPVPDENRPGHHPEQDQDKPPADAFAEALGIKSDRQLEGDGGGSPVSKAAAKKATAKKAAPRKATAKKAPAKKATAKKATATAATAGGDAEGTDDDALAGRERSAQETGDMAKEAEVARSAAATDAAAGPPATTQAADSGSDTDRGPLTAAQDLAAAAVEHYHALPDELLPHDTGLVTPSGAPVTVRVLTFPVRAWLSALRAGGGAVVAYGRFVRRTGQKLTGRGG